MTIEQQIMELISDRTVVPSGELLEAIESRYPFFTLPLALYIIRKNADMTSAERKALMARLAINAPNRMALFRLVDPDGERLSDFYPESGPSTPTTDTALDTFLDIYGKIDPHEQALLERMIFNPVPEYAGILAKEARKEQAENGNAPAAAVSRQDEMLDAYLKGRRPTPSPQKPDPDAPLSESLAKIYIKQRRFDKAYEIIKSLSLNFPKKSAYFADQLRFLQKLILNNKK